MVAGLLNIFGFAVGKDENAPPDWRKVYLALYHWYSSNVCCYEGSRTERSAAEGREVEEEADTSWPEPTLADTTSGKVACSSLYIFTLKGNSRRSRALAWGSRLLSTQAVNAKQRGMGILLGFPHPTREREREHRERVRNDPERKMEFVCDELVF